MHEQRAQWESLVFSKSQIDEGIERYLSQLFKSDKQVSKALQFIQESMQKVGDNLWLKRRLFNADSVKTTIRGVLRTDVLSEEKVAILQSFQSEQEVLQEVANILNMRYASLNLWQWTSVDGAIPVQQRRQLDGKYRVFHG